MEYKKTFVYLRERKRNVHVNKKCLIYKNKNEISTEKILIEIIFKKI